MSSNTKLQVSKTSIHKNQEPLFDIKKEKEPYLSRKYQGFNLDQADPSKDQKDGLIEKCLVLLSYLFVIVTLPFSLFIIFVVVRQFERAVILRNGKLRSSEPYGPGLVQYLPCVDTVKFTDLRIICYAVPPQEALTKDALTVAVDAVVYYKIYDPIWVVVNIADYNKDISLPPQLQRTMATEAESYRMANAKIIVAKSEIESTRNLQKATKLLMDNPYCMQLRYLQALQMIAGDPRGSPCEWHNDGVRLDAHHRYAIRSGIVEEII